MEEWLQKIIDECRKEAEGSLNEIRKQPMKISMSIESGKDSLGFDFDLTNMAEKFLLPTQLLQRGFEGIEKTIQCLGMPLKRNYRIRGYSDSKYVIPYYLEDGERIVLFEPLLFSGFLEAFGLGELSYSAFSPFIALEFFKYVDIMNAQKKPAVMAFFGLTGFKEIREVNFLDFIASQLKMQRMDPKREEIQKNMKARNIYEFIPRNLFKVYGIPEFRIPVVDALQLSSYDPRNSSGKRKLRAYGSSIGIRGFLNPTIADYSLFMADASEGILAEDVGDIMRKGKALGHSPSQSKLVPNLSPTEALSDPLNLMKELKKLGMLTAVKGRFKLTTLGLRLVDAEIIGKPKEWSLAKVWNIVKKAKETLPFLRFLPKE